MKKHRRNEHGAITVFLSGILIFIIAFMGMTVDLARMRVAEAQIRRASQLALDSVMTGYSRTLREDYGLFGYAGGNREESNDQINNVYNSYLTSNLEPDAVEEDEAFIQLIKTITGHTDVSYGDMLNLSAGGTGTAGSGSHPLSDPEAMYRQVLEFSKFRVPINMALTNTFGEVTQLKDGLDGVSSDNKAYDRINDLGEPTQEYYDCQDQLGGKVKTLKDAVQNLSITIGQWNELMKGEGRKEISGSVQGSINAYRYLPIDERTSIYVEGNFIEGSTYEATLYENTFSITAEAYDVQDTVDAVEDMRSSVRKELHGIALDYLAGAVNYQNGQLQSILDQVEAQIELAEEYEDSASAASLWNQKTEIENLIYLADQTYSDAESDYNQRDPAAMIDSILGEIERRYEEALKSETQTQITSLERSAKALEVVIDDVESAIGELEKQGKEVRDEASEIDGDLLDRNNKGKISEGVYPKWQKGELKETTDMLDDDEKKIEELKESLKPLKTALKDIKELIEKLNAADIASDFMANGVDSKLDYNVVNWDYSTKILPDIGFGGEYKTNGEKDRSEYDAAKGQVDSKKDEGKNALSALEKLIDDTQRFASAPIPEDYKKHFISVGEAAEDTASSDLGDKDPAEVDAGEVHSDSAGQTQGLDQIAGILGNGLQYVLGIVYVSEYILNMFSNAAPAQQENKFDAESFEHARVINLRNEYICGTDQYDKLRENEKYADLDCRLSYFYNAEVEYILFGRDKESSNVNSASVMLNLILMVCNYLQVRDNEALSISVDAAAAAGASIGIPPSVTRFVLFLALAGVETGFDSFYLMHGFKIPALSTDGMKLFMMNTADANSILNPAGAGTELMINYEFYLRIRLMMALFWNRDAVMQRMANLMQLNINYAASKDSPVDSNSTDGKFRMNGAFTSFSANSSARMPYWFMTMAVMGKLRQGGEGYKLPEYEIVASY